MAKKPSPPARSADTARKIWLAGIGAYGRAFSEAQESLAKMSGDTTKLFEELVEKGEEIEDAVETRGKELARRVKAPSFSIDERIKQMRERLTAAQSDNERLDSIERRLASIEEKLDALLAQSKKPAKKTVKKKTTSKKRAS